MLCKGCPRVCSRVAGIPQATRTGDKHAQISKTLRNSTPFPSHSVNKMHDNYRKFPGYSSVAFFFAVTVWAVPKYGGTFFGESRFPVFRRSRFGGWRYLRITAVLFRRDCNMAVYFFRRTRFLVFRRSRFGGSQSGGTVHLFWLWPASRCAFFENIK